MRIVLHKIAEFRNTPIIKRVNFITCTVCAWIKSVSRNPRTYVSSAHRKSFRRFEVDFKIELKIFVTDIHQKTNSSLKML